MMSDRMVGFLPGRWHRRSPCCWLRSVHSPCCLDGNTTLRVGQSTQNREAPRNGPEEASAKAAEKPSELGISALQAQLAINLRDRARRDVRCSGSAWSARAG